MFQKRLDVLRNILITSMLAVMVSACVDATGSDQLSTTTSSDNSGTNSTGDNSGTTTDSGTTNSGNTTDTTVC